MKPRISQAAMDEAEQVARLYTFGRPRVDLRLLRRKLKFWHDRMLYWSRPPKSVRFVKPFSRCRRNVIILVMALEIKINRPRWYRRPL